MEGRTEFSSVWANGLYLDLLNLGEELHLIRTINFTSYSELNDAEVDLFWIKINGFEGPEVAPPVTCTCIFIWFQVETAASDSKRPQCWSLLQWSGPGSSLTLHWAKAAHLCKQPVPCICVTFPQGKLHKDGEVLRELVLCFSSKEKRKGKTATRSGAAQALRLQQ